MPEKTDLPASLADLERRIDRMQDMGDDDLGTFGRLDWIILVVIAIILPVIALVAAR
jgi:hypothetical protein